MNLSAKLSPIERHFIDVWTSFMFALLMPLSTFALIQVEIYVWVEFSYDFGFVFLSLFMFGIWVTAVTLVKQILVLLRFDYEELYRVIFTPFDTSINANELITDNQKLITSNQVKYTRVDLN